ncbi:UDP-N-acetylglucosamine 2-epimerase, partial [Pseudomonas aeruginosa]|uniref:UDP-N-acetylglucosamine 2-epimerase n=1 Tax=Pseudomonas aeruginosa TaxID=287 RepID=UPI002E77EE5F
LARLGLEENKFFVVSAHREENIDTESNFLSLVETLNEISEKYDFPVIVSTHPRTMKRVEAMGVRFHANVRLLKPGTCQSLQGASRCRSGKLSSGLA